MIFYTSTIDIVLEDKVSKKWYSLLYRLILFELRSLIKIIISDCEVGRLDYGNCQFYLKL